MNGSNEQEKLPYPWYQAEEWSNHEQGKLEQGDLLPNCPVLVLPKELPNELLSANHGDKLEIPSQVQFADLIIMSQSCDLAHDKIEQVLLCAHFPASSHGKDTKNAVRKEQRPALHMIEKCEIPEHEFEQQIVDFRTIYTLPKSFVLAYVASLGVRVRLLPPYKEHLSQAFARYFMRVGLPRDLKEE
jgi:hypothetical protein